MRIPSMRSTMQAASAALFLIVIGRVANAQAPWTTLTRTATDIAVGANGTLWITSAELIPGTSDHPILSWDGKSWNEVEGGGIRIAVDPSGVPWVTNSKGELLRRSGNAWIRMKVGVLDVGIGANGAVWATAPDWQIYQKVGNDWRVVQGRASRLAVDANGNAWTVDAARHISRWNGSGWTAVSGAALDIAIAPDGGVYIIGRDPVTGAVETYRLNGDKWVLVSGAASGSSIAAGPNGMLYVVQRSATGTRLLSSKQGAVQQVISIPMQPGMAIPVQPVITIQAPSAAIPIEVTTAGSVGVGSPSTGSVTSGTLIVGTGPVPTKPAPLVVVGLPQMEAPTPGSLICPIITSSRLQKGCSFTGMPALFLRKAPSTTCPSNAFFDPENGGECWSCPASYVRNVSPVTATDACWKPVTESLVKATRVGGTGCKSGYFTDPRNGGECWQCPSGYYRTLDAVTTGTACAKGIFGPFSVASFGGAVGSCSGSSFFDPLDGGTCWTCPASYRRTLNPVTSDGACAMTIPTQYSVATIKSGCAASPRIPGYGTPFRDPRNDGECWVCPIQLKRSASPVYATETGAFAACTVGGDTNGIVWQSPQYPEPGMFAWSNGLVEMAMSNPQEVNAFLLQRAGGNTTVRKQMWESMKVDPGSSAELKALMLASLITAVQQNSTNSAVKASVSAFEQYARRRRTFVANEAWRMYDAWGGVDAYNMAQATRRSSGIGGMDPGVLGSSPADFVGYAWQAAVPDSTGVVFLDAFGSLSNWTPPAASVGAGEGFRPEYLLPLWKGLEKGIDKYDEFAGIVAKTTNFGAVGKGMQSVGKGAFIAMTVASSAIDLATAITTLVDKSKAAEMYSTIIADADKPYSVKSALASSSDDDRNTLILYWALATEHYSSGPLLGKGAVDNAAYCRQILPCVTAKTVIAAAAQKAGY